MDKILDMLHELQQQRAAQPLTAQQNLKLTAPQAGQLHRTADFAENPEMFYLVTQVNLNQTCDVIPGSLDGIMAGPNDAVISPQVMGSEVFLALDLATTIPNSKLGMGFARFDEKTLEQSRKALQQFQADPNEQPVLPRALPYFSTHESRYQYHQTLAEVVHQAAQSQVFKLDLKDFKPIWPTNVWENMGACGYVANSWMIGVAKLAAGMFKHERSCTCVIDNYPEEVEIEFAESEKILRLKVWNSNGEYAATFDDWKIVHESGQELATIQSGKAIVRNLAEFDGKIALLDIQGNIHLLTVKN